MVRPAQTVPTVAVRYSVPIVSVVIAALVTMVLPDFLAPIRLFFFWCAVLASGAMSGIRASIVATVLSAILIPVVVFEPVGSFRLQGLDDVMRLALFVIFVGGIGVAVGALRVQYLRAASLARDREEALTALRTSELTYRSFAELSETPQSVWTASPDGQITWAGEWLEITGQSREDLTASGGLGAIAGEDAKRTGERWLAALRSGSPYEDEIRVRVRNGRYRWFAIRAVPILKDGAVLRWVGVVADIHERKRRENESAFINRATAVLTSSLDYEKTLRDLARLCVPQLADWCAIDIARDGEPYQRFAVEHVDPQKARLVFDLDRKHRVSPDRDPVVQVMTTGKSQLVEEIPDSMLELLVESEQLPLVRSLGLQSWIMVPMSARGRNVGVLTLVSAESGRRHSAEDLPFVEELGRRAGISIDNARLYNGAEQANRAKDEFLATLSHELRTPLTTILGWANMLQIGLDEETATLAVDTIVRSANTQGKLIEELLDLSRIVAGKLELNVEDTDLVSLVRDVIDGTRPAADGRGIALTFNHPAQPLFVRGDSRRLSQIIWNLLGNALKFTEPKGRVNVRLSAKERQVRIEIHDTGRGIDPTFLPYVWERFRQGDSSSSRTHGGLGLGLAVVRYLTEAHGGTVSAESAGLGRGATFVVTLPLIADAAGAEGGAARVEPARRTLSGRRVLVIDDDADTRLVIATMLKQFGAEVRDATNAVQALSLMSRESFDLVITDLAMPGRDGYSLLADARVAQGARRVPILALSAMSGPENRMRAMDAGFDDFLSKPIEPAQLAATVAQHLATS